jgi:hypothetical protein
MGRRVTAKSTRAGMAVTAALTAARARPHRRCRTG